MSFNRRQTSRHTFRLRAARRAFTLIEVTISVAIALVLMLGISQVFRVVGETVGTGTALAVAQRDGRSAQAVMNADFNSAVSDGAPFMMLYSQQQFAFANPTDLAGDKDGNPQTADLLGTGTVPEPTLPAAIYNSRSHRIDAFSFFGRGQFNRQTGADANASNGTATFVSNMSCPEAFLWYGHLNLADNNGTFTASSGVSNNTPGAGSTTVNPNNYFASSWILGRQQILLTPATSLDYYNNSPAGTAIYDKSYPGVPQYAYTNVLGNALAPLSAKSEAYSTGTITTGALAGVTAGSFTVGSSRLDIANTTIPLYRNVLSSYIPTNLYPPTNPTWYQLLFTGANNNRFQAQPFFLPPSGSPGKVTPEAMAYQAPIFVRGCTQFTVEYAGDYLNQNPTTGAVINAYATVTGTPGTSSETSVVAGGTTNPTDGQIDYYYLTVAGQAPIKKIRWYGLPRSTTNNSTISATNGDVVPLRDLWPAANGTQAPFEVQLPSLVNNTTAVSADYAAMTGGSPASTALASGAQYICAWGPNDPKPKMIRITMTVDDPGGRLGDGQTFEYIYTLP